MKKNLAVVKQKSPFKKFLSAAVGIGSALVAGVASAAADSQITAAIDAGKENVGAVATGLIAIAAILTGLGIVIAALKR